MAARLLQNNSSSSLSIRTSCFSSIFLFPSQVPLPSLPVFWNGRRAVGACCPLTGGPRGKMKGEPLARREGRGALLRPDLLSFHGVFLCGSNFQKHLLSLTPQGFFTCLSGKSLSSWKRVRSCPFPSAFPTPRL